MLGAIIGDIVGSAYEFNPTNDYNFEMFTDGSKFTDDTICTVAIADAILKGRDYGESLHDWCRRYMTPKGGYGGRFRTWVESDSPKPYGSYGNGSAMRVSPVGMYYRDAEEVLRQAELSAACTHNHPMGINGAKAIAWAIHCAIDSADGLVTPEKLRSEITDFVICSASDNGFASNVNLEDYKNRFDETCQGTIPPALEIIYSSVNFEDAIRKAVSLGADADTLGAIVGSIAEHLWGIPAWMKEKAMSYLTDEMKEVVTAFYAACEDQPEYKPKSKQLQQLFLYFLHSEITGPCHGAWVAFFEAWKERVIKNMELSDAKEKQEKDLYDAIDKCEKIERKELLSTLDSRTSNRITPEKIDSLEDGEIFVFGSNKDGHHMGGAAKAAVKRFGAVWGQGDGLQGQSYAISTMEGLLEMAKNVNRFMKFAKQRPDLKFYVTPIGCGIAGYTPLQVAPLFKKAILLPNVSLPKSFWEYYWITENIQPSCNRNNDEWKKWDKTV